MSKSSAVRRGGGEGWLHNLLSTCTEDMRVKFFLNLWRSWHLRNDCVHNKGKETILCYMGFLIRSEEEIRTANPSMETKAGKDIWYLAADPPWELGEP